MHRRITRTKQVSKELDSLAKGTYIGGEPLIATMLAQISVSLALIVDLLAEEKDGEADG